MNLVKYHRLLLVSIRYIFSLFFLPKPLLFLFALILFCFIWYFRRRGWLVRCQFCILCCWGFCLWGSDKTCSLSSLLFGRAQAPSLRSAPILIRFQLASWWWIDLRRRSTRVLQWMGQERCATSLGTIAQAFLWENAQLWPSFGCQTCSLSPWEARLLQQSTGSWSIPQLLGLLPRFHLGFQISLWFYHFFLWAKDIFWSILSLFFAAWICKACARMHLRRFGRDQGVLCPEIGWKWKLRYINIENYLPPVPSSWSSQLVSFPFCFSSSSASSAPTSLFRLVLRS